MAVLAVLALGAGAAVSQGKQEARLDAKPDARPEGRLDAQYTMSLAGLPIGKGSWVIDLADSQYTAEAKGGTTGLLRAFTGGEGTTASRGTLKAGHPVLTSYAATITSRKKSDEVRLTVANGKVKDLKVDPAPDTDPERVPVTPESERGVLDPMAALLVRVAGAGTTLAPEACSQKLSVFDGRLRYDLQLAFKRMDKVKAEKGYQGPVVVCAVYFSPIAGHIPSRAAIKYLAAQRDMEVWLAPIAGTRVLVPFRVQGPTPVGTAVLEATQFVAVAAPNKEAANDVTKAAAVGPKP